MPLVQISLRKSTSQHHAERVGEVVHRAMVNAIGIPEDDHFQIITEHEAGGLVYDRSFLGIERTDGIVIIQITLAEGRTRDQKKKLYKQISDALSDELDIRPEDVFVGLLEVSVENFSFGNGEAQYADRVPPHLQQAAG
jgi:phenylpyruvate tautomerase PptA (4-oxalocrotonate tautomerase family)